MQASSSSRSSHGAKQLGRGEGVWTRLHAYDLATGDLSWAQNADEYINKATQIHDDYRSNDLVSTAFGPHAPYTVSDEPLTRIAALAEELDVPIHMHLHENAQEVADAEATDGRRPLQRLRDLDIVSPRLLCVHATQLLPEEITLLATHGASVIHCPSSNMKLASGFCQVDQLLKQVSIESFSLVPVPCAEMYWIAGRPSSPIACGSMPASASA